MSVSLLGRLAPFRYELGLSNLTSIPNNTLVATIAGTIGVNKANYAVAVDTYTLATTLSVVGYVTIAGLTGTIQLYDLTNAAPLGTIAYTETTPTNKTLSVTLPVGACILEARLTTDNGAIGDFYTQSLLVISIT